MKKLLPLLVVLIASVSLAACTKKPTLTDQLTSKGQKIKGEAFTGKIQDVIAKNIPLECTYKIEDYEYESKIKGKKMRGKSIIEGKETNVIMVDECIWMWGDDIQENGMQGVTMCFDPTDEEESIWDQEGYQDPDLEYHCRPAVINDNEFKPPVDVNFVDFDQMLKDAFSDIPMDEMPENLGKIPAEYADEMGEMPEGMPPMPAGF